MSPRRGFGRGGCPVTMGSRRWLPHAVPLGLNTFRRGIIASRNGIIASRNGVIASRNVVIASRHGVIAFRHGAIVVRRNAATGCSHGREPMERLPSFVAGLYLTIRKLGSLL
jgi:hypothetical protein